MPSIFIILIIFFQIANRFSKDMDETDVNLPNTIKNFINQFLRIMGTLIIVTYTLPQVIFAIIPLTLGVFWVLKTYISTSRMLRRSGSATMALVNGHMSETLIGVSTIRAYRIQTQVNIIAIDIMNYRFLTTETNSKALYIFRCFLTQPHQ